MRAIRRSINSIGIDMEENRKISIVIPLYNGESYIRQTINSILQSTYQDLELLIINDGSTDNSVQICEEIQRQDKRIILFQKKNEGVVSARNYGAKKASGAYLCFCDQDDIVDKECYEKLIKRIDNDQSDICMCSTGRSIHGKISAYELSEDICYTGNEILTQLLYPLLFNVFSIPIKMDSKNRYPHIWSCMFRMCFWRKHQFQFRAYIRFEDDWLLKIEAFSKAERISTISHIGYYWRVNMQSETYIPHYIAHLGVKQQNCYEDMRHSISYKVQDPKVLEFFQQVTFCKQYLEAIHNFANLKKRNYHNRVKRKKNSLQVESIIAYFQENIYQRDFEHAIKARRYVKKGRIKPQIILPILAKRWTRISYFAEVFLDYVLVVTLHSQIMTKLERMLKGIR